MFKISCENGCQTPEIKNKLLLGLIFFSLETPLNFYIVCVIKRVVKMDEEKKHLIWAGA